MLFVTSNPFLKHNLFFRSPLKNRILHTNIATAIYDDLQHCLIMLGDLGRPLNTFDVMGNLQPGELRWPLAISMRRLLVTYCDFWRRNSLDIHHDGLSSLVNSHFAWCWGLIICFGATRIFPSTTATGAVEAVYDNLNAGRWPCQPHQQSLCMTLNPYHLNVLLDLIYVIYVYDLPTPTWDIRLSLKKNTQLNRCCF